MGILITEEQRQSVKSKLDKFIEENKSNYDSEDLKHKLYTSIKVAREYNNHVKEEKDGTFSIYPTMDNADYPFLNELTDYLSKQNANLEDDLNAVKVIVDEYNESMKNKLKSGKINRYYGKEDYLTGRVIAINKAMKLLYEETEDSEDKRSIEEAYKIMKPILISFKEKIISGGTLTREKYDSILHDYKEIIKIEESLFPLSEKVWQKYMEETGVRFTHFLTSGVVSSSKMDKICTSVSSPDCLCFNIGNVGYEYGMDMSHILFMCPDDVSSFRVNPDEFISYGILINKQYDGNRLCADTANNTKLYPPRFMMEKTREHAKACDGYTEVVFDNKDGAVKPVAAFYTENTTQEEYEAISEIAEREGLELIPRTNLKRRNL